MKWFLFKFLQFFIFFGYFTINSLEETNFKIFLQIYENEKNFVFGILKVNTLPSNESYFVQFSSIQRILQNRLCNDLGYDDIHSVSLPCKLDDKKNTFSKFYLQK